MVENQNKTLSEIRILAAIREEKTLKFFTTAVLRAGTPEAIEGLNQAVQKTAAGLTCPKIKVGELSDIIYLLERFLQAKKFVG